MTQKEYQLEKKKITSKIFKTDESHDNSIIEKRNINSGSESTNLILVYEVEKPIRKTGFKVYTDKTTILKSPSQTGEIRIPNQVKDFIKFPEIKSYTMNVLANYSIKAKTGKITRFENVESEIIVKAHGLIIRPTREQSTILKKLLKGKEEKICHIPGKISGKSQLKSTKFLDKAIRLRKAVDFLDFKETELVITGWTTNKKFMIFKDDSGELYITFDCRMSKTGGINIPKQVNDHINGFFECNEPLVCSIDFKEPIVVKPSSRVMKSRPNRLLKEFYVSYIGEPKTVNVRITQKGLKLTENTKRDFELKKKLIACGYNIISLKSNSRKEGLHRDPKLEYELRNLISKAFTSDDNTIVLSEVEIITKGSKLQPRESTKHSFDIMVVKLNDKMKLYNIELKTSLGEFSKTDLVDEEISSLNHFEKILGSEKVISIIIMNDDLISRKEIITRDFGNKIGKLIIGKNELNKIINNPLELKNIINDFKKLKEYKHKNSKHSNKINVFSNNVNDIDLIESKLPKGIKIAGCRKYNSEGAEFEKEIREQLRTEGYKIKSNLRFSYFSRIMEIDHIGLKNEELTIISCKDKASTNNVWTISDAINESANLIEYKKDILKADNAILCIKVSSTNYKYISKKYDGKIWAKNVNIRIKK